MAASFSLAGTLRIVPQWTDELNTTTVVDSATVLVPLTFTNGTGADQANAFWKDVRTVAGGASDTVAIDGLSLNVFGGAGTLDLSSLRLIYVRNRSTTQALKYEFDETAKHIPIAPGGSFVWVAGNSATAPTFTETEIQISNAGGTAADYEIVLVGVKS